jgi:hypothetical protein
MASPKKKKKKTEPSEPVAAQPSKPKMATPKSKIASILSVVPHHPIWAELNDPENEGKVWTVEFVNPPGVFMARAVPDEEAEALGDEIEESWKALKTGEPIKVRYILGMGYSGGHARRLVECITRDVPNPRVPFTALELYEISGTFRVVQ